MSTPSSIPAVAGAAASSFGDREAVVDGDRRFSFVQVADDAMRAARAFVAAGVQPGDKVAVWAPNSYEWITALLGLHSVGAALVPLNTRYKGAEAAYVLDRSRARVLVTVGRFLGVDYTALLASEDLPHLETTVVLGDGPVAADPGGAGDAVGTRATLSWQSFVDGGRDVPEADVIARIEAVGSTDVSDVIFTSGTTGRPKGVVSTHGQSIRVFADWSRLMGLVEEDRYLLVNPMFHTFGYKAGILAGLLTGARLVLLPTFEPAEVLRLIAAERVSVLPGPPTIYQALLSHPARELTDMSSLRLAVTGAAVIPIDLVRRIREQLGFETVLTAYGLTEATGFVTATRQGDDLETIATTSGRAIDGVAVRVVDGKGIPLAAGQPGEVLVRGYNVMQGYFEDPEQTAAAVDSEGWLHTGDVGTLDDAGNLRITDRLKDMFIVGGFNAYPAEIENLLLKCPEVAQVAVVGIPDERLGEVGVAFVVPAPGAAFDGTAMLGWARQNMANFKVPRQVFAVGELPLNASGKVVKTELRRRAAEPAGSAGSAEPPE